MTRAEDKLLAEVEKKLGYKKYHKGMKVVTTRPLLLNRRKGSRLVYAYTKGVVGEVVGMLGDMVSVSFFDGTSKHCVRWLSPNSVRPADDT